MEGNDCYKFSTIRNFLAKTGGDPIRLAVDIGCNIGTVTAMIREYFPGALVFAFEPVPEYYALACKNLAADPMVKVLPNAVTAAHRFADDLGMQHVKAPTALHIFRGLPGSGPGWVGGSQILRRGETPDKGGYEPLPVDVMALTLDELVDGLCLICGTNVVDYIKMDCEGCENSALGCATVETLRRIRFLSGEYHNLERFQNVLRNRLSHTHSVNLVGDGWGSFFAELKETTPSILTSQPAGQLSWRGPSGECAVDIHLFHEGFVLSEERWAHGI